MFDPIIGSSLLLACYGRGSLTPRDARAIGGLFDISGDGLGDSFIEDRRNNVVRV